MYDAIANEFERLLKEKQMLIKKISLLKKGSVSRKVINGKERFYHQYREGSKVIGKYIDPSLVDVYIKETDERKRCTKALSNIELQLNKIKRAAEILSNELYNRLVESERCLIEGKKKSKMQNDRVATYVRASKHSNSQTTIYNQTRRINAYCESKGYTICDSAFTVGNREMSYLVLMNLLTSAKEKQIKKLVIPSTKSIVGTVDEMKRIQKAFDDSGIVLETLDGSHLPLASSELITDFLSNVDAETID